MFYLIGGAPRVGKTTLAKKISSDYNIPWISVDTVESIILEYIPDDLKDDLFPKNKIRKETHDINDEMYSLFSTKQIVDAYIKQSKASWKAISTFVKKEEQYGHSYVIEGFQIHPELVIQLQNENPEATIKSIFVGRSDVKQIIANVLEFGGRNDWFTKKTINESTYQKIAEMIAEYSNFFKLAAEQLDLPFVNLDGDFWSQIGVVEGKMLK